MARLYTRYRCVLYIIGKLRFWSFIWAKLHFCRSISSWDTIANLKKSFFKNSAKLQLSKIDFKNGYNCAFLSTPLCPEITFMARNGLETLQLMVSETKIFKIYQFLPFSSHLLFFVPMIPVKMIHALEWPIMDGFSNFLSQNGLMSLV